MTGCRHSVDCFSWLTTPSPKSFSASHLNPDLFKLWQPEEREEPEEPEEPEYVGCYNDNKEDRVLSHMVTIPGMTTAVCREHCSDKDTLYYATQVRTSACALGG